MEYIIFGIAAVGVICVMIYQNSKIAEIWQEAADRLDLEFSDGGLIGGSTIEGRHRGVDVEVSSVTRGSRRRRKTYTVTAADVRAPCMKYITVTEHGLSDTIGTFFGGDDEKTGDQSFDSEFRITGRLNDQSRKSLQNPKVQKVLRDLAETYEYFKIEEGTLQFEQRQRKPTPSEVVLRINRAVDAAEIIDDAVGIDSRTSTEQVSTQQKPSSESLFPDPDADNDFGEPRQSASPEREPESSEVW